MGGEQAAQTLLAIQLKNRGDEVGEEEKAARLADIKAHYEATADPRYAASRLWVDGILDPRHSREVIAACLSACAHQGRLQPYSWGVLQT
jgi:3-methylcrotonyl-CoA carboxylase beta subunit